MTSTALIPKPGMDLVPDGWCESVVVPWLAEQTEVSILVQASARLAGLEAAYKTLNSDVLELIKARRLLEVRWGELLGPAEPGQRTDLEPSLAAEGSSLTKHQRSDFRELAKNAEKIEELVRSANDADQLSRNALLRAVGGAHVGHNSGDNEWYTPVSYINAAIAVMGGIDLDPASTAEANEVIGAERYYTQEDDGLKQSWHGRVWMNPPYARPLIDNFCQKLADEFVDGNVTHACVLVNNATETGWFHALADICSAICFPRHRVKFWHPNKEGATPLQGQAVVFLGEHDVDRFRSEFVRFGFVLVA